MSTNKRIALDKDQFTLLSGRVKYLIDLPGGEIDLWVQWMSDVMCTCWLVYVTGERFPYQDGTRGHFNVAVKDLVAMELETGSKTATVCIAVAAKPMHADARALSYEPVLIAPPPPVQLQMSHVISKEVMRQLRGMGIEPHQQLEVDQEDDLEGDDMEEEELYGPGFMEPEETPTPKSGKRKPAAGDSVRPEPDPKPSEDNPAAVESDGDQAPST